MKTGIAVSIEEYLTNPAYEHCEYVGGEVVEKPMGTLNHGKLQGRFFSLLESFSETRGLQVATEVHCRLAVAGEAVYRLPDVMLTDQERFNESGYHEGGPTLAIEIRSPEDRIKDLLKKAEEYLGNGTKLVWVVDPSARHVMVLMGDRVPWIVEEGEELSGAPVWPDLKVDLSTAFRGI